MSHLISAPALMSWRCHQATRGLVLAPSQGGRNMATQPPFLRDFDCLIELCINSFVSSDFFYVLINEKLLCSVKMPLKVTYGSFNVLLPRRCASKEVCGRLLVTFLNKFRVMTPWRCRCLSCAAHCFARIVVPPPRSPPLPTAPPLHPLRAELGGDSGARHWPPCLSLHPEP